MANEIVLLLPWPPTGNNYVRHTRRGIHYVTAKAKAYHDAVARIWSVTEGVILTTKLRVVMHCTPPDKRKRDLDNLPKVIFDSLTKAGVIADDHLIRDFRVMEFAGAKGTVNVFITAMED